MIPEIKKLFSRHEYKRLFNNILNLSFFQGINYLLPLITIPYIVRIVGPEKFGILSFAEIINRYFVMVTDYGFNITGTQKISVNRRTESAKNEIFSTILVVKILLMIFCFIILYTSLLLFTGRESHLVFLLYYLIIPGNILLSYWFFLGMEEMHFLNIPNIISRLGYTIFIFVFLKQENQFYLVPLFYGTFLIAGGLVSLLIIFFRYKIKFAIPSLRVLIDYLKEGWSIFISTFAINLYRKSNVFILGLVAPKEAVGFYSAGEKIIIAIQSVFNPIIQAFYPFVSRRKSISIRRGLKDISFLLRSVGTSGLLVAIFFILFSGKLTILFLGKEFSPTIPVLRLGGLVICIGVLNYILGIIFMTNFGFKKEFATRVMITGIFNLIFCFVMSYLFQEIGAAVSFLVAEVVLFLLLIIFTLRNKSKWSPEFV